MLFLGKNRMERRVDDVEAQFAHVEPVANIVAFIRNSESRPLCHAGSHQEQDS